MFKFVHTFCACTNKCELAAEVNGFGCLNKCSWPLAGKKYDIISTMLSVGKYLSSTSSKLPHMEREASFPGPPPPGVSDVGQMSPRTPPVAESSTASVVQPTQDPQPPSDHLYSLPLSTDELGRLPIYDPFHYEFTFHYQPDFHTEPSLSSVMQPESFNSLDLDIGDIRRKLSTIDVDSATKVLFLTPKKMLVYEMAKKYKRCNRLGVHSILRIMGALVLCLSPILMARKVGRTGVHISKVWAV